MYVCYFEGQWGKQSHLGKQVYIFQVCQEPAACVCIYSCLPLFRNKRSYTKPPKLLGSVKLMCVELEKMHSFFLFFSAKTHVVKHHLQAFRQHNTTNSVPSDFQYAHKQPTTEITTKLHIFVQAAIHRRLGHCIKHK